LPLSEKARIEVYLPDLPRQSYQDLRVALEQEFTYTFGGCTTVRALEGKYLAQSGEIVPDRVSLVYTDVPFSLQANGTALARYTDEIRDAAFRALDEEAILVVVLAIHHSERKMPRVFRP
jgi:hypothetical protein